MFNVINKYPKSIVKHLLELSAAEGYMSILEDKRIIDDLTAKYQIERQRTEQQDLSIQKEQESKMVLESKRLKKQAIENSGESEEYWNNLAKKEILEQFPSIDEVRMLPILPAKVTTLLKKK